ncbi:hypothetical protein, partial [Streptomyces katsurahamanus]|uniref:hypothetical protein n=1 Tax=Streptomyces katsurahamanus TaxID=2577098 RepID=UPI00188699FE
ELLRYLNSETSPVLEAAPAAQVGFNYLGRFATGSGEGAVRPWELAGETAIGGSVDPDVPLPHALEVNATVRDTPDGPELEIRLSWPGRLFGEGDVEELGRAWLRMLEGLAAHTTDPTAGGHTPSDFPLLELTQESVDELESAVPGLADIWPLSPLQEGMLFHATFDKTGPDAYQSQRVLA